MAKFSPKTNHSLDLLRHNMEETSRPTMLEPRRPRLSMKEGSLFCSYEIHRTNWDASDCVLDVFGKLSTRRGDAWVLVPWRFWTCGAKALEY